MNNIPGYLTEIDCKVLHDLASSVNRKDAVIVELGSLHGKSSSIISKACPLGRIFCIDPWWGFDSSVKGIDPDDARSRGWPVPGTRNTVEFFQENTKDCRNITAMKTASPKGLEDFHIECDMVFLDAAHTNPSDRENIDFWLPKVKKGGVFAGHDYSSAWPDVMANVAYIKERLGIAEVLTVGSSIWYFYV